MIAATMATTTVASSAHADILTPSSATSAAGLHSATTHIAAELVPEGPAVPGGKLTLAIHMTPAAGWHGYWLHPGDAGYAMRLTWHLPAGASYGEPAYPVPQTLLLAGLMNHVYLRDYAVLVPITVPANATTATDLPVSVDAEWLACSAQICVPESATLTTRLRVISPGAAGYIDPRFDQWRAALPAPLGGSAHFVTLGKELRVAIPLPASMPLHSPHLFVASDGVVDYAAPQSFVRAGDTLVVTLSRPATAIAPATADNPTTADANAPGVLANLPAVLSLGEAGPEGADEGLAFTATPGAVPSGGVPLVGDIAARPDIAPLYLLVLAALAGGLLLNIMPCVFPILSLKALSLARAGESEADARAEGLAYSAGVVLACLALGAGLLALRAGGQQVGWAFQLQEPGVVVALLALAVAITANLLGLFELAVPGFAQNHARRGAFATGLLAAFVATPCTGPFMASAMGAALLLPVAPALLLFAALGLGIALPFLGLAFVPALRALMPRPGAWMNWFRRAMAVPMAITAAALVWLASRVGGWSFAGLGLVLTLVLLVLLATVGRAQRAGKPVAGRFAGSLAGLCLLAAVVLPRSIHAPQAEAAELLPARPFTQAALAQALASGHPVFAFFTADWCLTCKVNERLAIERVSTRDAFARAGVIVLTGDWTRRDPAITRYLTAHGAAGVPFYMWYPGHGALPRALPQVLTPGFLASLPSGH